MYFIQPILINIILSIYSYVIINDMSIHICCIYVENCYNAVMDALSDLHIIVMDALSDLHIIVMDALSDLHNAVLDAFQTYIMQ
jgi:hypothetical protein